jgi:GWxTD domain-containing protein
LTLYEEDGTTPHLQPFVSINQPLILTSILPYFSAVHCFYYSHQFDEAVPPMVIEDQRAAKSLTIDSVFSVRLDEKFTLRKEGLYFFQKDSTTANGIAIRVQNEHYPLAKTFENVLAPLIYISTRSETDQIRSAPNQKEAFENYWIELVKIPKLASSTVRQYYEGVEGANFLFTSYKEGWKSDMGLIYTIYGPPNDVYKSEEIIDWVYNQDLTMPNIRFSFYRVKNVFLSTTTNCLERRITIKTGLNPWSFGEKAKSRKACQQAERLHFWHEGSAGSTGCRGGTLKRYWCKAT